MASNSTVSESSRPATGRIRWKSLAAILGVGGGLVAFFQFVPLLDNAIPTIASNAALALTTLAVVVWCLHGTGLSPRGKLLGWSVVLLLLGVGAATTRFRYRGNLQMQAVPRRWVVDLGKRLGVEIVDVIHQQKLADPPLSIEPTPNDAPQFLGPQGLNVARLPQGKKLSRDWSQQPPRELWRRPIGDAWSSFAVVGNYAFTQEESTDLQFEQTTCYDLSTGDLKWVHADAGVYESSFGGIGPRATPTFYDGKIVAYGAQGLLNCFEAATGRLAWTRNPVKASNAKIPDWGLAVSPLVFRSAQLGDLVVISAGGESGRSLQAFQLADGKPVWSVGNDASGYCSPELRTLGGVPQIVLVNWQAVTGHHPDTGAELWRYEDWQGINPKVPQPIVVDDRRVLLGAGYGTGSIMLEVTRSSDGKWTVKQLWKSTKLKPKFTNLVVYQDHVYGLDDGEFLICLSLADGEMKWRSKRGANYGHGQLLLVDDLLLLQTEAGDVALVAPDPQQYRELTRFTALPRGTSWNQPVVVGTKLLVRNDEEAACFELPTEPAAP